MKRAMFLSLMLGCASAPALALDDIYVARASFAGGVEGKEASPAYPPGQRAAPGPLWFWTEIRVTKEAVAELRKQNLLPLQHRWYRSIGGIPSPDETPDFFRNLEEIDDRKMGALTGEAEVRDFFTYRTASCRAFLKPGTWIAAVTDVRGNPLSCSGQAACRFTIQVSSTGAESKSKCLGE